MAESFTTKLKDQILELLLFHLTDISNFKSTIKAYENIQNTIAKAWGLQLHVCGSYGEGFVCVPPDETKRDIDCIRIDLSAIFYQYWPSRNTASSKYVFLAEDVHVHPGYLRLVLVRESENEQYSSYYDWKLLYECPGNLNSKTFISNKKARIEHKKQWEEAINMAGDVLPWLQTSFERDPDGDEGPAASISFNRHNVDVYRTLMISRGDIVLTLKSPEWPRCAIEWLQRPRFYGWPNREMIDSIVQRGCMCVPVGYPGSATEHLEWRYSFVLAERELVWSFNQTQRLVYFILKILNATFFKKLFPNTISSYHIKTLIFWAIEETAPQVWNKDNVFQCTIQILERLLRHLENKCLPSYFVSTNNLFEYKITDEKLRAVLPQFYKIRQHYELWLITLLSSALKERLSLLGYNVEEILGTSGFDLFKLMQREMKKISKRAFKSSFLIEHVPLLLQMCFFKIGVTCLEASNLLPELKEQIDVLRKQYNESSLSSLFQESIVSTYCSLQLCAHLTDSSSLQQQYRKIKKLLSHLRGFKSRIGRVRHANALYQLGNLQSCLKVTEHVIFKNFKGEASIISVLNSDVALSNAVDSIYERVEEIVDETEGEIYEDALNRVVPNALNGFPEEPLIPLVLIPAELMYQHAVFKIAVLGKYSCNSNSFSVCMIWDPLTYASLLRFFCIQEMGCEHIHQLEALKDVLLLCNQPTITPRHQLCNAVGHCLISLGLIKEGLRLWTASRRHERQDSSALWHTALLVYKSLKKPLAENKMQFQEESKGNFPQETGLNSHNVHPVDNSIVAEDVCIRTAGGTQLVQSNSPGQKRKKFVNKNIKPGRKMRCKNKNKQPKRVKPKPRIEF